MKEITNIHFKNEYSDANYIDSGSVYDSTYFETNVVHFVTVCRRLSFTFCDSHDDVIECDIKYTSGRMSYTGIGNNFELSDYQDDSVDQLLDYNEILEFVSDNAPSCTSLEIARECDDDRHSYNLNDYEIIDKNEQPGFYERMRLKQQDFNA